MSEINQNNELCDIITSEVTEVNENSNTNKEVEKLEESQNSPDTEYNQSSDQGDPISNETEEEKETDRKQADEERSDGELTEEGNPSDELSLLREENKRLREELEANKRLGEQLSEFSRLFPEQDISNIPQEVWADVQKGSSLAASFALFERRREVERNRAKEINQLNAYRSSGHIDNRTVSEYFSPDEVRAMSQSEVRANYSRIIESMKKWN